MPVIPAQANVIKTSISQSISWARRWTWWGTFLVQLHGRLKAGGLPWGKHLKNNNKAKKKSSGHDPSDSKLSPWVQTPVPQTIKKKDKENHRLKGWHSLDKKHEIFMQRAKYCLITREQWFLRIGSNACPEPWTHQCSLNASKVIQTQWGSLWQPVTTNWFEKMLNLEVINSEFWIIWTKKMNRQYFYINNIFQIYKFTYSKQWCTSSSLDCHSLFHVARTLKQNLRSRGCLMKCLNVNKIISPSFWTIVICSRYCYLTCDWKMAVLTKHC
jgi:hypothetical protein